LCQKRFGAQAVDFQVYFSYFQYFLKTMSAGPVKPSQTQSHSVEPDLPALEKPGFGPKIAGYRTLSHPIAL
jgi:hypothetical protein